MPVHEAPILEIVTFSTDLQLPPSETFPFIKGNLEETNTPSLTKIGVKRNSHEPKIRKTAGLELKSQTGNNVKNNASE